MLLVGSSAQQQRQYFEADKLREGLDYEVNPEHARNSTDRFSGAFALGYVNGVAENGYVNGVVDNSQNYAFCLNPGQVSQAVIGYTVYEYLTDHPEQLQKSRSMVTVAALENAYPCPKEGPKK